MAAVVQASVSDTTLLDWLERAGLDVTVTSGAVKTVQKFLITDRNGLSVGRGVTLRIAIKDSMKSFSQPARDID